MFELDEKTAKSLQRTKKISSLKAVRKIDKKSRLLEGNFIK